ncbi:MAG TPA: MFS transporter [Anaerolineales bacterium]|nr:MFS transporter [Anaerolineales bacterium]
MSDIISVYIKRLRQFSPNARLLLVSIVLTGASLGVYRLLFNFYALSLGIDESIIGNFITVNSMTALLVALPMGYVADFLGRKRSFIIGGAVISLAILGMVIWPSLGILYLMNVLMGAAQSLSGVTMAPFLLENSGEEERTYLFSLSSGIQMLASFAGNSVGGYLPSWIADWRSVGSTSSVAYGWSLGVIASLSILGLIPFFAMNTRHLKNTDKSIFAPIGYAVKNWASISKMVLPLLITSIGAGLFMPFMNIFFRVVHNQPDPVIGNVLAWGALAMGIGLVIAPPIADRIGKIKLVVLTQGLSIPFLMLLGYSPWFWMSAIGHYVRLTLMNMGGPVYNAFVMEHVEPEARAMVASLTNMAWNFGWAFSPSISGFLQINYGFNPVYLLVIILYSISVFLYWKFFWIKKTIQYSTS